MMGGSFGGLGMSGEDMDSEMEMAMLEAMLGGGLLDEKDMKAMEK